MRATRICFGIPVRVLFKGSTIPSCPQLTCTPATICATDRGGISTLSGKETTAPSGEGLGIVLFPLCAAKMETSNLGFSPTANVLALQSITAACLTRKSAPNIHSTDSSFTTVNTWSAWNSPRVIRIFTWPITSSGRPFAAIAFWGPSWAMRFCQQLSSAS